MLFRSWTDEVQWAFQRAKHALAPRARAAAGGDIARGFCTAGPFAVSRHLNFFAEQSLWVVFWAFSVAAGAPAPNWGAAGAALLIALFQGSTWMTELLTAQKYPAYARYQQTTSRLLPWWPGAPLDDAPGAKAAAEDKAAAKSPAAKKSPAAAKAPAQRRRSASPAAPAGAGRKRSSSAKSKVRRSTRRGQPARACAKTPRAHAPFLP